MSNARALAALAKARAHSNKLLKAHSSETAVLAALTAWFGSKDSISADELPTRLVDMLVELGLDRDSIITIGEMATVKSLSGRTSQGSPEIANDMSVTRRVAADEPYMRAMYVLAAAKRLSKADNYDSALSAEKTYLASHVSAGQNRRRAAKKVDDLGDQVLVWRTVMDEKTTPECAAADGRLFTADKLPNGMIPGAVHARCRCHAEPWGNPLWALQANKGISI